MKLKKLKDYLLFWGLLCVPLSVPAQVTSHEPRQEDLWMKFVSDRTLTYREIISKCDSLFAGEKKEWEEHSRDMAGHREETPGQGREPERARIEEKEDGPYNNYIRWRNFWGKRLDVATGKPHSYGAAQAGASSKMLWRDCRDAEYQGEPWRFIGPRNLDLPNLGRVQCISVNPNNSNEVYVSDFWGGLWKTTNKGGNWVCLTDNDPSLTGLGVQKFVVNYAVTPHVICAAIGYPAEGLLAKLGNRTSDIYLSPDDGQSYQPVTAGSIDWDVEERVTDMVAYPSNPDIIFATTQYKVLRLDFSPGGSGLAVLADYSGFYGGSYTYLRSHFNGFNNITFPDPNPPYQPSPMLVTTKGVVDGHTSTATLLRTWDCLGWGTFTDITTNLSTAAFTSMDNLVTNGSFNTDASGWLMGTNPIQWTYNAANNNVELSEAANPPSPVNGSCLEGSIPGKFSPYNHVWSFSATVTVPSNSVMRIYLVDFSQDPPWEFNPACQSYFAYPHKEIFNSQTYPGMTYNTAFNISNASINTNSDYFNRIVVETEFNPGYNGNSMRIDNVVLNGSSIYDVATAVSPAAPGTIFSMVARNQDAVVYIQKSTDYGNTWTDMGNVTNMINGGLSSQGWPHLYDRMAVSTINPNNIYYTLQHLQLFQNGNTGPGNIAHGYYYWPAPSVPTHADVRSLLIMNTGSSSEDIYAGHDGGLSVYSTATGNWTCLTCGDGYESSMTYSVGSDPFTGNIAAGAHDNGFLYSDIGDNYTAWTDVMAGDGFYIKYAKRYALKNARIGTSGGYGMGIGFYSPNGLSGGSAGLSFMGFVPRPKVTDAGEYYSDKDIYRLEIAGSTVNWNNISGSLPTTPNTAIPAVTGHPADRDIVAAYVGNEWDGGNGRFVMTTDGGANWTVSSNNPFNNNVIIDMAIDPLPYGGDIRMWASASWYNGPGKDRVFVSVNNGDAASAGWTDYSTGLPDGPVNSIVYDDQGRYLFAATDIGVYYRFVGKDHPGPDDPQEWASWVCYSKNLPNCIINDLDINRCANKLYAASFGRGIWEADLPPNWNWDNGNDVASTIEISFDQTWSNDDFINKTIVINPGVTLEISGCTINMARNKNIVVLNDARLILDNATITNTCKCMWGSIVVVGDPNQPQVINAAQDDANQGILVMRNNSLVEHAYLGVLVSKSYYDGDDYPAYTAGGDGGVVIATDSRFRNCTRAIAFNDYGTTPGGPSFLQKSVIDNCEFIADEYLRDYINYTDYSSGAPRRFGPKIFITSWANKGVKIKNSVFRSVFSSDFTPDRDLWTMGIGGGGANFLVEKCTFENLSRGILSSGDAGSIFPTRIIDSKFGEVWRGITVREADNVWINNNDITMGEAIQYEHRTMEEDPQLGYNLDPYGIYVSHATGFNIQDNIIQHTPDASETYGIILNDVHNVSFPNLSGYEVYRNNITADYGVAANQDNKDVQIKCNELYTANKAIMVTHVATETYGTGTGILSDQGWCGASNQSPAGNQFFNPGTPPCGNKHLMLVSGSPAFDYRYHAGSGAPVTYNPACHTATITVTGCNLTCAGNNCCPDPPVYVEPEYPDMKLNAGLATILKDELHELSNNLTKLNDVIGQGNSSAYRNLVDDPAYTSGEVKTELLKADPYLSDEILIKTIGRVPRMNYGDLKEILTANASLRGDVLQVLKDKWPALYADETFMKVQSVQSARRTLEGEIYTLELKRNNSIARLVNYYAGNKLWKEAADLYEDLNAYHAAISFALNAGDFDRARQLAGKLDDADLRRLDLLFIDRLASGRRHGELNADEERTLSQISIKGNTFAGEMARLLRGQVLHSTPLELMPVIPGGGDDDDSRNAPGDLSKDRITLYPNPANNTLHVKLFEGGFSAGTIISAFDITGRRILRIAPEPGLQEVQFNTSSWVPGIYLVNIDRADGQMVSRKVTIQH